MSQRETSTQAPARAGLVLVPLIGVAGIANLNLSVANDADWAYAAGIIAVLLGALLVYVFFPNREREAELLAAYHSEHGSGTATPARPVVRPQS